MTTCAASRLILLTAATLAAVFLGGCGVGGWPYYSGGGVAASSPYPYQYYYAAGYRAYYCYYPGAGWRYLPGSPPVGASFYSGPVAYLPAPGPPIAGAQYYFDARRRAYYYRGPQAHWHYFPGRPQAGWRPWHGPRPHRRDLPRPPGGGPQYRQQQGGGPPQYQQQQRQYRNGAPNNYQNQGGGYPGNPGYQNRNGFQH